MLAKCIQPLKGKKIKELIYSEKITDDQCIANALNDHFSRVGETCVGKILYQLTQKILTYLNQYSS